MPDCYELIGRFSAYRFLYDWYLIQKSHALTLLAGIKAVI